MLAKPLTKPTPWSPPRPPSVVPPSPRTDRLPTMYELPYESEDDGMPDLYHDLQPQLLSETFCPPNYPRQQVFVASDLYLYYDPQHTSWYKRPDWFTVLGVPRDRTLQDLHYSYVIWEEKVSPYLIVELLSEGTEDEDLGKTVPIAGQPTVKWEVYERILKVPYYVVYSRQTLQLQVFQLMAGRYRERPVTGQGIWLPTAQLGIGVWTGDYLDITGPWLRFYDAQGRWIPTQEEQTVAQTRRADAQTRRADAQARRADAEADARHRAEQQVLALEAELARLKALLQKS